MDIVLCVFICHLFLAVGDEDVCFEMHVGRGAPQKAPRRD
jgi:hypothetical protein